MTSLKTNICSTETIVDQLRQSDYESISKDSKGNLVAILKISPDIKVEGGGGASNSYYSRNCHTIDQENRSVY